jgi:hypothetical protein
MGRQVVAGRMIAGHQGLSLGQAVGQHYFVVVSFSILTVDACQQIHWHQTGALMQ